MFKLKLHEPSQGQVISFNNNEWFILVPAYRAVAMGNVNSIYVNLSTRIADTLKDISHHTLSYKDGDAEILKKLVELSEILLSGKTACVTVEHYPDPFVGSILYYVAGVEG